MEIHFKPASLESELRFYTLNSMETCFGLAICCESPVGHCSPSVLRFFRSVPECDSLQSCASRGPRCEGTDISEDLDTVGLRDGDILALVLRAEEAD